MPKTRNVRNVKNVRKNRSLKKRNNRNKSMRKKSLRKGGNKNRKTNKRRMRGGMIPRASIEGPVSYGNNSINRERDIQRQKTLKKRTMNSMLGKPRERRAPSRENPRFKDAGKTSTEIAKIATNVSRPPSWFNPLVKHEHPMMHYRAQVNNGIAPHYYQSKANNSEAEWEEKYQKMIESQPRMYFTNSANFEKSLKRFQGPSPAGARNIQRAFNEKRKAEAQAKLHRPAITITPKLQLVKPSGKN